MHTKACPTNIELPYTSQPDHWHIQGQSLPIVIVCAPEVDANLWESLLSNWHQHYQILLSSETDKTADLLMLVQSMQKQCESMQVPLYIVGLHQEISLACQLAAKLPQLSGLILLSHKKHDCNWLSMASDSTSLQAARRNLPQHLPVLTIWLEDQVSADPAAAALSQEHAQHEWMVLPASSNAQTIAQLIHSWTQSPR